MKYYFSESEAYVYSEEHVRQVLWEKYRKQGWTKSTDFDKFIYELLHPEDEELVFIEVNETDHDMLVHVLSEANHLNCEEQWEIDELSSEELFQQIMDIAL